MIFDFYNIFCAYITCHINIRAEHLRKPSEKSMRNTVFYDLKLLRKPSEASARTGFSLRENLFRISVHCR